MSSDNALGSQQEKGKQSSQSQGILLKGGGSNSLTDFFGGNKHVPTRYRRQKWYFYLHVTVNMMLPSAFPEEGMHVSVHTDQRRK